MQAAAHSLWMGSATVATKVKRCRTLVIVKIFVVAATYQSVEQHHTVTTLRFLQWLPER
jgi:uncharacterized membrane protein YadS